MSAASRPRLWPLILRGLWWRRGVTAAILAVAALTTAAAAIGPLYARAAGELILHDHLVAAGTAGGLRIHRDVVTTDGVGLDRLFRQMPKPGTIRGYRTVVPSLYTPNGIGTALTAAGTGPVKTALLWKQGQCKHIVIVRGHCPRSANEALASQRTIASGLFGWHVGTTLDLGPIHAADVGGYFTPVPTPKPVHIVGAYRPRSVTDPFWFGQSYFQIYGSLDGPPTVDTLIVSKREFTDQPPNTSAEAQFDFPLSPAAIRLKDVPAERAAVARLIASFAGSRTVVDTRLLRVFDAVAAERSLVSVDTTLVTVQLALLAWLVLFQVVADAIEARGGEIALAKLRGHRPRTTLLFGLGEPVLLTAIAVPIGLLLAFLATHLLTNWVLSAQVPVAVTAAPVLAAGAAFVAGLVAVVFAGYRALTRPVLEQWRRTTRAPQHGRAVFLADMALAVGAGIGLVVLHRTDRGGGHNSAALLVPGLLVLAVALLGVRLLPAMCRVLARATRFGSRIGLFLASRQVARRPVGLRLAALLAVAVGLATFAVAGETVAQTNRQARARADIGAQRVVSVQVDPRRDPIAAVRTVDPRGRWAMAAATWLPDGGGGVRGRVLAVDGSRLTAIGSPVSGGLGVHEAAAVIGAAPVPTIRISADRMRVRLSAGSLRGDVAPQVQLNFRTPTDPYVNAEGPAIRPGPRSYVLRVPCRHGCVLRGLTWDRPINAKRALSGVVHLRGLDVATRAGWRSLNIGLGVAKAWRAAPPQGTARDHVTVTAAAVSDRFWNALGGYGGMTYADAPVPVPAIATPAGVAGGSSVGDVLNITDESNSRLSFSVARMVHVLPAVLDHGVMLDVDSLTSELPGFAYEADWAVWLGPRAPADALARLRAAGLDPTSTRSEAGRVRSLSRQAPALALLLLLGCAVAGAVLAAGGTAFSISAAARRRSYELAALRAVGTDRGALLRAGVLEQLLLLGAAVVLGVPTGLLAARLAMPIIPEFADHTPITLRYVPQWLPTMGFAAAFVLLMVLTAFLAGRGLLRIAMPSRLREAEA